MAWNPSSPVTGAAQTGFTSPTYTLSADVYPSDTNGKQHAITAVGGTQVGVTSHTVSAPFTLTFVRPKTLKTMPSYVTGQNPVVPKNTYKVMSRKGVTPAVGLSPQIAMLSTDFVIPAGADTYDIANLRALISLHIGALSQLSAGLGDTVATGIM